MTGSCRVFVDNFTGGTSREALHDLFAAFGTVESVTFPNHSMRDVPTHAFVVMASAGEAAQAIKKLNNTDWQGARLSVSHASDASDDQRASGFSGVSTHGERKNR